MNNQGNNLSYKFTGQVYENNLNQSEYTHVYEHFPKDFERKIKDLFDKRFILIWIVSFIIHFSIALYFAINPPKTGIQRSEIDRIQKQFATLVLEQENKETQIEPESLSMNNAISEHVTKSNKYQRKSGTTVDGGRLSEQSGDISVASSEHAQEPGNVGGNQGTGQRQSYQEQISQQVSSKGLLGLLTGSGSNARGEAVSDLLGEAADTQGDLDKALGDLEGLKKSNKSGDRTIRNQRSASTAQKGIRSTEGSGINNLIAGKEQIKATDIQRQGNIVVEQISEIADERGIKSESRNPDKVSEVINRHNSSIQYCYQRELKQNPELKGKLVVRFTVTPDGKVKDVKVISSTLNNFSVERCVVSRIKRWDDFGAIDPSKGDATFRQVYTFGY